MFYHSITYWSGVIMVPHCLQTQSATEKKTNCVFLLACLPACLPDRLPD